ncbi:MAG: hypothetical protein ACQZ3N_02710 [cyanobacterium endosymbiont of Rhopalodia yunnanensis]
MSYVNLKRANLREAIFKFT